MTLFDCSINVLWGMMMVAFVIASFVYMANSLIEKNKVQLKPISCFILSAFIVLVWMVYGAQPGKSLWPSNWLKKAPVVLEQKI